MEWKILVLQILVKLADRFKMQIQVLYCEKYIFPPQKDYMDEISQLLVHTLEGMRTKERAVERQRRGDQEE